MWTLYILVGFVQKFVHKELKKETKCLIVIDVPEMVVYIFLLRIENIARWNIEWQNDRSIETEQYIIVIIQFI